MNEPIEEIDVLWINAGLSCDGDTVAMTAATQPGVEGSIPDESNKAEGYWAAFGTDEKTGQPIPTCEWIDKLAPKA